VALRVSIADVSAATPRSRLLHLDLGGQPFPYRAGQAVMLGAADDEQAWPFSIACSPGQAADTGRLQVLIALADNGESPNLPLEPGAVLDLAGPLGEFTLPDTSEGQRLLFVAGGTGIAPLHAMLDQALRTKPGLPISLLYSARHHDEFAFVDELQAHAAAGRLELHLTVTREVAGSWQGRRGRIDREHFADVLHDPAATQCVICGPPTMVRESVDTLQRLGVPPALIHYEQWGV